MEKENIYISFYEWNKRRSLKVHSWDLVPQKSSLMSCPVQSLSIYDIGREINKIKRSMATASEQKQKENSEKPFMGFSSPES